MADPPGRWPPDGVLAVTKLHVPDRRAGLIDRDALVDLLCADHDARLTLISAPPGAGRRPACASVSIGPPAAEAGGEEEQLPQSGGAATRCA